MFRTFSERTFVFLKTIWQLKNLRSKKLLKNAHFMHICSDLTTRPCVQITTSPNKCYQNIAGHVIKLNICGEIYARLAKNCSFVVFAVKYWVYFVTNTLFLSQHRCHNFFFNFVLPLLQQVTFCGKGIIWWLKRLLSNWVGSNCVQKIELIKGEFKKPSW